MRTRLSSPRRLVLIGLIGACLLTRSPTAVHAQSKPLQILLTNDDGFDAPGLQIMRSALAAAGHHVTVVAPATDFSGAGASMSSGVLKIDRKDEGGWAVHGTPADSALIGLAHILRDTPQDLVVSGTNRGQNLGTSTNSSGTVGAAVVAAQYGVPAIAISAGIGADITNAYNMAASLAQQIIVALQASRPAGAKLLPDRAVVNVNVPALPQNRQLGVKFAPLSRKGSFTRQYQDTGTPGEVRAQLVATPTGDETETDLASFTRGYTTVTILDGDWSLDAAGAGSAVAARLSKLAFPVPVPAQVR